MRTLVRRARSAVRRRRALLAAWRRMSSGERADLARLGVLIPAATVTLQLLGFHRTVRLIERLPSGTRPVSVADEAERSLVRALERAGRYAPYRGNCLSQSLALWGLLRRRGIDARLHLGARITDGAFSAHAWVECNGRIVNDAPDVRGRFKPFRTDRPERTTPAAP